MPKGKAFIVVGHSSWGKSRTLRQLTGSKRRAWIQIRDVWIFIRRMSNDDIAEDLRRFLDKIDPNVKKIIIITLCPNFDDPERKTKEILKLLKDKYTPSFFVLKRRYNANDEVSDKEITALKSVGVVEVINGKVEDTERARKFKQFVEDHL
jgi:hypothetical protein